MTAIKHLPLLFKLLLFITYKINLENISLNKFKILKHKI